jgi:exosome complex component RRP41
MTSRNVDLLSDEGYRIDGRRPHEVRRVACRMGIFEQADGSAYIEMGNTRVLAAVYGPHEVRSSARTRQLHDRAAINCQYSMATFSTADRKARPRGDYRSLEITANIKEIFETAILVQLYPHSQIDIYLEVLQSDGSNYAACVNAATLALIHAGICLKDVVCASSAGLIDKKTIVDVNYTEESISSSPVLTIALMPKTKEVLSMESTGRLAFDSLDPVMEAASQGCLQVYEVMRESVLLYVTDKD